MSDVMAPRIDGERQWQSHMEMAKIGATPGGGVCRLSLSDEDKISRDLLVSWAKNAGCHVRVDRVGNIFMRRLGAELDLPVAVTEFVGFVGNAWKWGPSTHERGDRCVDTGFCAR